jgi:hypothetical protein
MAQHYFSITRIQARAKQQQKQFMKNRHTIFTATVVVLSCLAVSLSAQATCQEDCLGNENTVLGDFALLNTTGGANTAIGSNALFSNTTGSNNTAMGFVALIRNTSGEG